MAMPGWSNKAGCSAVGGDAPETNFATIRSREHDVGAMQRGGDRQGLGRRPVWLFAFQKMVEGDPERVIEKRHGHVRLGTALQWRRWDGPPVRSSGRRRALLLPSAGCSSSKVCRGRWAADWCAIGRPPRGPAAKPSDLPEFSNPMRPTVVRSSCGPSLFRCGLLFPRP